MTGPDPGAGDGQDPEAQRVQDLDARFGRLERAQAEQKTTMEAILSKLGGGSPAGAGSGQGQPGGGSTVDLGSIQDEVRAQISQADARRAKEEGDARDKAWRDGVDAEIEKVRAERQPREPESGLRARMGRLMFGRRD